MLTPRENLLECLKADGKPDRFVAQWEPFSPVIVSNPLFPKAPGPDGLFCDDWGCYQGTIPGQPGLFPVHDDEHIVIPEDDICEWRDLVKVPGDVDDPELWAPYVEAASKIDRNTHMVTCAMIPGIFERLHHLHDVAPTLVDFYEEPEEMHALIEAITDYEMRLAEAICKYVKPDAILHHDDLGTQINLMMSTEMLNEFLLEPYKKIYGYYHDHGVQVIMHHSDTFGETLIPFLIEAGADIWQGAISSTNDIPALVEKYKGQIAIMGGIESQKIEKLDWTEEDITNEVDRSFEEVAKAAGPVGFIPCLTSGLDMAGYPGIDDVLKPYVAKKCVECFPGA